MLSLDSWKGWIKSHLTFFVLNSGFLQHKIMMGWENSCNSLNVSFTNTDTPLLIRLHRQFLFFCRILREFRGLPLWLVRYCRWRGGSAVLAWRYPDVGAAQVAAAVGASILFWRHFAAHNTVWMSAHEPLCTLLLYCSGSRLTQPRPPTPAMYGAMCRLIREHWIRWKGMHLSSNSWTLNDLNRC